MLRKLQPVCQVKLEELRSKIRKGLKSGPSEPWDAATLKKKARAPSNRVERRGDRVLPPKLQDPSLWLGMTVAKADIRN